MLGREGRYKPQTSPPQLFLFGKIRSVYPTAKLNHPILTDRTIRFADIAIIIDGLDKKEVKLDVEYDGFKEHKNRKKQDRERDLELARAGWETIRINKKNLASAFKLIEMAIHRFSD